MGAVFVGLNAKNMAVTCMDASQLSQGSQSVCHTASYVLLGVLFMFLVSNFVFFEICGCVCLKTKNKKQKKKRKKHKKKFVIFLFFSKH